MRFVLLLAVPLLAAQTYNPEALKQAQIGLSKSLKERSLGVEVFGRAANYDTNQDPVVRVTAAEVRKKLAQYYLELDHRPQINSVSNSVFLNAGIHSLEVGFFDCCDGDAGVSLFLPAGASLTSVPEPGSLALIATGAPFLFLMARRRRKVRA